MVAKIVRSHSNASTTVALVCDGMGGMIDGGRAAAEAAGAFLADLALSDGLLDDRLRQAVWVANDAVHGLFHGRGGTTLTAVAFDQDGRGFAAHVGDSRLYRRTHDELKLVTTDDTIQGVVHAGSFEGQNEDELDSQLIQFVGIGPEIEPHILPLDSPPANVNSSVAWLITSDGAHGLGRHTLTGMSKNAVSVADLMRKLMFVAEATGVSDNATAVILQPHELATAPSFSDTTTIFVWTPVKTLELWIDDQPRVSSRPPRVGLEDDAPKEQVRKKATKAKRRSTNRKVPLEDKPNPRKKNADADALVGSKPQLNIRFGDDPPNDD